MTIDWITVAAQLINFLVLVWLLKRFLYRPILDGIDARESEIAERMSEAARIKASAESTVADYEQQRLTLQQQQASMREEVQQQATAERETLLEKTRDQIRDEQAAAKQQQQRQAGEYVTQLHQIGARAMLGVVNKALHDLSDETLEERLVLHALASLDKSSNPEAAPGTAAGTAVGTAAETPAEVSTATPAHRQPGELTLTTRAPLDEPARHRIQTSVEAFWPGCELHFDTDEQQSAGALVQFGSSQVLWTVDSYVDELESNLQTYLDSLKPGTRPATDGKAGASDDASPVHDEQEVTA